MQVSFRSLQAVRVMRSGYRSLWSPKSTTALHDFLNQRVNERWALVSSELGRIEWTNAVSASFGLVKAELEFKCKLIEDFDIAIAAHALAWDATLVSGNTKHFQRIEGLQLEDWA